MGVITKGNQFSEMKPTGDIVLVIENESAIIFDRDKGLDIKT